MTHKLQLIVLLACLAMGCYFYIIHRDLENYVGDLHEKVQYLLKINSNTTNVSTIGLAPATAPAPAPSSTIMAARDADSAHANDIADDVVSVSSKDIKDLLTNIYEEPDDEIEIVVEQDSDVDNDTPTPDEDIKTVEEVDMTKPIVSTPEFDKLTDAEILAMKYDDIRSYLRKHGVHMKGTKAEMVAKLRELHNA